MMRTMKSPLDDESGGPWEPGALPMLMTFDETATLLRTTRKAIYIMNGRGLLPGVIRLRRRVLVQSAVLLEWLRQKRAPSPKEWR